MCAFFCFPIKEVLITDKKALLNLPDAPGVYLMKDKNDEIIYIGKAKVLKNRIKQYFTAVEKHPPKVRAMVSNIASFEYIITDSEIEALILECNLIKKHKPYYNILLKDDKHYPYIKVTVKDPYPKILFTRKMVKDGAKYYGPYASSASVREMIDMASKLFKLPNCNLKMPQDFGRKKVCLNAHIGQCIAPCVHPVTEREYNKLIEKACKFFEGDHTSLLKELEDEMQEASRNLEFERAAFLRDKISAIKKLSERQKMISDRQSDEDVIGFYRQNKKTYSAVLLIRSGRLIGRKSAVLDKTGEAEDGVLCAEFLKQFYAENEDIPKAIYTCVRAEDEDLIANWLSQKSGRKVTVHMPVRGEKKQLTEMACKNARQNAVDSLLRNSEKNIPKSLLEIREKLNLKTIPKRMEAYDISHTAGEEPAGSMIVFADGKPHKSSHRRFKIPQARRGDDAHSLVEMLYRRMRHAQEEEEAIERGEKIKPKFLPLPDVVLLDGGRAQVQAISELFEMLDCSIPLFGLVKDERHRTRALITPEGEEISFLKTSEPFRLLAGMQEEVHRFAIEYHKKLRAKKSIASELDEIAGVGEKTKQKLLGHFKTIKALKAATLEELSSISGLSQKTAQNIFEFFHKKT